LKPKFRPLITKQKNHPSRPLHSTNAGRPAAGVQFCSTQASYGTLLAWSLFVASTLPDAEPLHGRHSSTVVPMLAKEGRFQQAATPHGPLHRPSLKLPQRMGGLLRSLGTRASARRASYLLQQLLCYGQACAPPVVRASVRPAGCSLVQLTTPCQSSSSRVGTWNGTTSLGSRRPVAVGAPCSRPASWLLLNYSIP